MAEPLVVDAGPLIALAHCELLPLLAERFRVHVPTEVVLETTADRRRPAAGHIAQWLEQGGAVCHPAREATAGILPRGAGEQAVIALAGQLSCRALIDDRIARAQARAAGLPVWGTVGLLLRWKQAGAITAVAPLLDALVARHGYRLSNDLIELAKQQAGE